MLINLFDDNVISNLFPLTLTRPAGDLRVGILTIAEKWEIHLSSKVSFLTQPHLANKFITNTNAFIYVNGKIIPNTHFIKAIKELNINEGLYHTDGKLLAYNTTPLTPINYNNPLLIIERPYDIFKLAETEINSDLELLNLADNRHILPPHVSCFGTFPIYIHPTATLTNCSLNASKGPIYIAENAEIMEGSYIRGSFALGKNATVKMGTKIYGATAIGPYSVIGGELSNVSIQGYSNKGHDGFLGNAVLGEWCNIGADSNCSNLKNNYEDVKVWNYTTSKFDKSGSQFCGLIMGDHSKCGINTMFNTGTVVGVACNIFGSGFPRQFIPDFSWGGANGFVNHKLDAAIKTASLVLPRRGKEFNNLEVSILTELKQICEKWHNWDT